MQMPLPPVRPTRRRSAISLIEHSTGRPIWPFRFGAGLLGRWATWAASWATTSANWPPRECVWAEFGLHFWRLRAAPPHCSFAWGLLFIGSSPSGKWKAESIFRLVAIRRQPSGNERPRLSLGGALAKAEGWSQKGGKRPHVCQSWACIWAECRPDQMGRSLPWRSGKKWAQRWIIIMKRARKNANFWRFKRSSAQLSSTQLSPTRSSWTAREWLWFRNGCQKGKGLSFLPADDEEWQCGRACGSCSE